MKPHTSTSLKTRVPVLLILALLQLLQLSPFPYHNNILVEASDAARTETLVGIVGKDFVLLMADSSVSQGLALQSSNLDKIATLSNPFPDGSRPTTKPNRQMAIASAAAGEAADTDRLTTHLKSFATVQEYQNGWGCDVRRISSSSSSSQQSYAVPEGSGLDVQAMANYARTAIAGSLRSAPLRVCLMIAGMKKSIKSGQSDPNEMNEINNFQEEIGLSKTTKLPSGHASSMLQQQVQQAWGSPKVDEDVDRVEGELQSSTFKESRTTASVYEPCLYWLDEYGSMQQVPYGVHGFGSNLLLSILDRTYKPEMTLSEATALMQECFQELRHRFVINSPQEPCLKCVDANGIHWIPFSSPSVDKVTDSESL